VYVRYPVRNFKCPFCGERMPTQEYKGWKPWVCPGCSAELQFSEAHGSILQLCFFVVALFSLYLMGIRGWQLAVGTVLAGFVLAVIFGAPLDRILPPRLEPYKPSPWKQEKSVTLFPYKDVNSDTADEPPPTGNEPQTKA
jgi:hypothetical protein